MLVKMILQVGLILCFAVALECFRIPEIQRHNRTFSEMEEFRVNLIHSSILYGILSAVLEDGGQRNVTGDKSVCDIQLNDLYEGVNAEDLWALKVLDASGATPEAYMWGSNFWLGSRQECNSLSVPIDLTLTDEPATDVLVYATPPFAVDYRVIYLNMTDALQIDAKFNVKPLLHLGLCVPKSCTDSQIFIAVEKYTKLSPTNAFATYHIQPKVIAVKTPSVSWSFLYRPELIALVILCSTIMIVMMTRRLSSTTKNGCNEKNQASLFLECFSFQENLSYIFNATTPKSISAIAGIRSIVCIWIVAFHILYYGQHYRESASLFLANSEGIMYQVIWSAAIYVDVFFALSAFLLAYNILGNMGLQNEIQGNSLGENLKLFGKHVLHRYIRLTPALLATVLQTEIVNQFMQKYSSFHISETRDFQCESTWWYNLLYIQNFLDMNAICGGWTWYLACDFQYFIVFLLLLFVFVKSKSLGKLAFIVVAAIFIPITFYTLYRNNFTFRFDAMFQTLNDVYQKFWCRINPYITGVLMGYIMRKILKDDIKMKKIFVVSTWACIAILLPSSLTATYWRNLPVWACSLIFAGGRAAIGIGTGIAIILCHLGHGGWFNVILSHGIFQHFQKLSYTIYLLNPLVIFFLAGVKEKGIQVDFVEQLIFFVAVSVITYALAVVNTLIFERPFQKLSDTFILRRGGKTSK